MLWMTLRQLKSNDEVVRIKAVTELGKFSAEQAVEYLQPVLSDESYDVRFAVVRTLASFEDRSAVEPLLQALNDRFASIRQAAAEGLGKIGDPVAVRQLIAQLDDSDAGARGAAYHALKRMDSAEAVQAIAGREHLANEAAEQILDRPAPRFLAAHDLQVIVDQQSFAGQVTAATPQAYVVYALIGINILIFLGTALAAGGVLGANTQVLLDWGANYAPLTMHGEWWRIITCTFLHVSVMHIGLNMWILFRSGPFIEKLFGHFYFLLIFITSAMICSLTIIAVDGSRAISVGASGGLFGMYGAVLAYLFVFRHEVPATMIRIIGKGCAVFILVNLILGFAISGLTPIKITNAGNVAGAISGFVYGLVVARPLDLKKRRQQLFLQMGIGAVCSALATLIFYVAVSKIYSTP